MQPNPLVPLVLTTLLGATGLANEWSHGAVSEAIGFGHHHLLDTGGYHCVSHADANQAARHQAHMHANATNGSDHPHANCPGGASMHGRGNDHMHPNAIPPPPEESP